MKKPQLVMIEWLDSSRGNAWRFYASISDAPQKVRSVGWLLHDGKDSKTVAPHVSVDDDERDMQCCGEMVIPTCAITRIKRL